MYPKKKKKKKKKKTAQESYFDFKRIQESLTDNKTKNKNQRFPSQVKMATESHRGYPSQIYITVLAILLKVC